jgi:hypothetical protein
VTSLQAAEPAQQIPRTWAELAPQIRQRLTCEGLDTPAAWLAAGKRRLKIFGIPRSTAKLLDQLARGAP